MLALFRPLCWCFILGLYSGLYIEALYHGFILGFILGFMPLVLQAAPCELNPLAPGDSIVVFGFVLSYVQLFTCCILENLRRPGGAAPQQQQRQLRPR